MGKMKYTKELDKKIIYYYRNGWKIKAIAEKLKLNPKSISGRLCYLRKRQEIKRWWEE